MDLYDSFSDDEIVVTNPVLEKPVVVGISRPDVLESFSLSDKLDEFRNAEPKGRKAALRSLCAQIVPCIRFVREVDDDEGEGMEVTFGGQMWGVMTEPDKVEACVRVWAIIVKPIIVELTGRVAGSESLGKSQRRSAEES